MATTSLSTIRPDQVQIITQLHTILSGKSAWKDLYRSGTGETLVEMIAAIGAVDQYAIEQAFNQTFLDTALTDSAVFAITRMLGVRLPRMQPCSATVILLRDDTTSSTTIPPYSAFNCNSISLFNREAIFFATGVESATVQLYEGELNTFTQYSNGTDFQMFKSTENEFQVADQDVFVTANDQAVPIIYNGIWKYKGQQAINDSTTKEGELLLTFGNDQYGYKPASNVLLRISYAITKGTAATNAGLAGNAVSYLDDTTINGTVMQTGLTGGGDHLKAETLRKIGPQLFSAQDTKATTEDEFSAMAVQYPQVLDALVVGQHKIAPTDVRYMNLVRVSLLTPTPMTAEQWNDFSDWYKQRIMYPVRFYRQDPLPVSINISAILYCRSSADLVGVQANATAALNSLLEFKQGTIGFNIYKSDIYEAILESDERIVYIELQSPTGDVIVDIKAPTKLEFTDLSDTLNGTAPGGTGVLPIGYNSYGVSSVNATGESLVTNFITTHKSVVGGMQIRWNRVPGAIQYKVYGRLAVETGLIYTIVDGVDLLTTGQHYFNDVGIVIPKGAQPALDSSGVHYATKGSINLSMQYTQRQR